MALRIIIALVAALLTVEPSFADRSADPAEAVSLFAKGKRLLHEGNWYKAASLFEELAGRYPGSENLDRFVFYRAKAKYYLGEFNEAVAGFTYFLSISADSEAIPYARFFLGNAYYRRGNVTQAVESYFQSYRMTNDSQLGELAAASLTAVLKNASAAGIGKADLEMLADEKRCSLVKLLASVLADRGDTARANQYLSLCGDSLSWAGPGRELLDIAMVLPFSGDLHSFGQDVYDGAVVAANLYRSNTGDSIALELCDTRGDPIDAARIVSGLAHSRTDVAVGPLTSEAASVASASLTCASLPLLIPAATQAGLTRLSESSFQISPNIELQGVKVAEYAVEGLDADSAVVITSTGVEHLRMARAFAERFQQLGGIVVAMEYYHSRDKDFGPCIRDAKGILLGRHPDSIFFVNEVGDTLDPDGIPANIDCLYLPGDPSQIRLLLPQINFYNLKGAYLGSDAWGDEAVLKLGDDITKRAVFPSPFLIGTGSEEYMLFAAAYDARFGQQPNRLAGLGYDAVKLAARAFRSGARSKEALTEKLSRVRNYDGASGKITFGRDRENIEMPLFRILSGEAVPLASVVDSSGREENR